MTPNHGLLATVWPWLAAALALAAAVLAVALARARREARTAKTECEAANASREAMLEALDGMICVCSEDMRIEYMNAAMIRRAGRDATGEICHQALYDQADICPWCVNDRVHNGETVALEIQNPKDGRWYHMVNSPLPRPDGSVSTQSVIRDVTGRKRVEQALRDSERRYRIVADHTASWEYWSSPDGRMLYVSPACSDVSGHMPEDFMQDPGLFMQLVHADDREQVHAYLEHFGGPPDSTLDFRVVAQDGRQRWVCMTAHRVTADNGKDLGLRASIRDITDRKQIELQLRHQALHDPLTSLGNRVLCLDRIAQALQRSKRRDNYHFAVVFVDLDRFKRINDSYGHSFGDQVLKEVSRRVQRCVRSLDLASRFGGDEFVLLLEELESPREALRIVKRAGRKIQDPIRIDGQEIQISASCGVMLSPAPSENAEDMLRNANIALHRAKEEGRNKIRVFSSKMREAAVEHMALENDLRRALTRDEFLVHYQPILNLEDSSLTGFEALVRWKHPEKGIVPPGDFIPAAEDSGLIVDIGALVLERACADVSRWSRDMPEAKNLLLSVNLSARQFSDPTLVERVRSVLRQTGMQPQRLKLEITESTIMENADLAVEKLGRLKELGIQISIDDFGTGYSSMSYLQRFPLDHLKIDLSFVSRMNADTESQEIVKAIIQLAHSLGLKVIAEGVEHANQHELLHGMQCEYGQGYLFSRPVPGPEAEAYIRSRLTVAVPAPAATPTAG